MLSPGRFIVLEGIEGVGKTTQRERLRTLLTASNIPHRVTREPGGTALGEHVRDWILSSHHPVCSDAELLLLFAARAEHVAEVIQPALSVGEWVIADRFVEASFAYQGGGRQLPLDRIEALAEWTLGDMHPDLTILLDAPVEVSMARIQARGDALDRIEQERRDFFERVRAVYLMRAHSMPERFCVVDALQPVDVVHQHIVAAMHTRGWL